MKSKSANSREEGMALLFALGFLAMLLVLGLGFVTTSLLSQKLAANNGTRVQARMLARSAAARAALCIMLYDDQAIVNAETIDAVPNYDAVRSYGQVSYNNNGTAATGALDDQLKSGSAANAAESKLNYAAGGVDYNADDNDAKWIYFYDSPSSVGTGRKIIGRVAFQVLPKQSRWLSLYGVTGGAKLENNRDVIPYNYRWGRDIDELNPNRTITLENWSSEADKNRLPATYDVLYNTYSSFFPGDTDSDRVTTARKKKWVEYWFSEGRSTLIKDAFPVEVAGGSGTSTIYYNRFNVGDRYLTDPNGAGKDNWYDRFLRPAADAHGWAKTEMDGKKNSSDAVDALADDAVPYQENDTDDTKLDAAGLPFLKRIGNEPHSFSSLELLRRQIAANLNDYCDADSIPTSDIPATGWSITDDTKFPRYTGNERTLYINEIALKLSDFKVKCPNADSLSSFSFSMESLTPTAIAELVNMYDPDNDSDNLLKPDNYKLQLGLKKLAFDIGIKAVFEVGYNTSDSPPGTGSVEVTVAYSDGAVATVNYAPASPAAKVITPFSRTSESDSYSYGSVALDVIGSASITQPEASTFTDKIRDEVPPGATVTSIRLSSIECQIKPENNPQVGFYNLRLENTSAGNVDYVRMEDAGDMTLSLSSGSAITLSGWSLSGGVHTFAGALFVGGIEARDPRQNLNPKFGTPATSDWNLHPTLVKIETDGNKTIPSMTIGSGSVTAGLKNRYADPHAPQYVKADGTAEACNPDLIDVETATDPAWKGGSSGDHVSTAYIRNAPMVSPWELGLIHRGREWQTLSLKSAGGFGSATDIVIGSIKNTYPDWSSAGTAYENGDGAILEFTKMTPRCRTMGKVPLKQLRNSVITTNGVEESYNKDIVKMLFDGVRVGQTMKQFYEETKLDSPSQQGGAEVTSDVADEFVAAVDGITDLKLRSQFLNTKYGVDTGNFTFGLAQNTNDALQEELIGKTINLLAVDEETPPNVFKVIVVAQTIRDVGGIGANVSISKLHNGASTDLNCQLGRFDFISDANDWENNTYYDEITGEVKALVTLERVPSLDEVGNPNENYGRIVIRKIEYID